MQQVLGTHSEPSAGQKLTPSTGGSRQPRIHVGPSLTSILSDQILERAKQQERGEMPRQEEDDGDREHDEVDETTDRQSENPETPLLGWLLWRRRPEQEDITTTEEVIHGDGNGDPGSPLSVVIPRIPASWSNTTTSGDAEAPNTVKQRIDEPDTWPHPCQCKVLCQCEVPFIPFSVLSRRGYPLMKWSDSESDTPEFGEIRVEENHTAVLDGQSTRRCALKYVRLGERDGPRTSGAWLRASCRVFADDSIEEEFESSSED